eukprot:749597-Hanusia_phi.AAC.4
MPVEMRGGGLWGKAKGWVDTKARIPRPYLSTVIEGLARRWGWVTAPALETCKVAAMAAPKRRREEEEAAEDVIVVEEEEDETRDETEHDTEDEGSDANAEADEEEEMEEAEADDNETASASGQIIHILDESDEESTSIAPSSPDLSAPPEWLSFDVGCVQRQVQVAQEIAAALQPHQREGLRFMWKHVAQEEGSGCILADGMGLGKTLQAIALVHTCLRALVVRTALVLCPAICVRNWADEVDKWTPDVLAKPFLLQDDHGLVGKLRTLERWRKEGGLLVLSYESFLSLASPRSLRPRQDRSCSEQEESGGLWKLYVALMQRVSSKHQQRNPIVWYPLVRILLAHPAAFLEHAVFNSKPHQESSRQGGRGAGRQEERRQLCMLDEEEEEEEEEDILQGYEWVDDSMQQISQNLLQQGERRGFHDRDVVEEIRKEEESGKLRVMLSLVEACLAAGDKVLIFSQSLVSLQLIGETLSGRLLLSSRTAKERRTIGYYRIDGSTPGEERHRMIEKFNEEKAGEVSVMLISTRAGGEGVSVTGANRVILFDVSWNPCHDVEASYRAFRLGQRKRVYVYRLVGAGTMEDKVYRRQVVKQRMMLQICEDRTTTLSACKADIRDLFLPPPPPSLVSYGCHSSEADAGEVEAAACDNEEVEDVVLRGVLSESRCQRYAPEVHCHLRMLQGDTKNRSRERRSQRVDWEQEGSQRVDGEQERSQRVDGEQKRRKGRRIRWSVKTRADNTDERLDEEEKESCRREYRRMQQKFLRVPHRRIRKDQSSSRPPTINSMRIPPLGVSSYTSPLYRVTGSSIASADTIGIDEEFHLQGQAGEDTESEGEQLSASDSSDSSASVL